jgi:hypothetical protein
MASGTELRALITAATAAGRPQAKTAKEVLEAVLLAVFQGNLADGRVLASVSDAGAASSFSFPPGMSPRQVMSFVQEAIDRLDGKIKPTMFKASFRKAVL